MSVSTENSLKGCLIGMAVGDSLGLPVEFLSPAKTKRYVANGLHQGLIFGKGMVSDDTENAGFTAISLIRFPNDSERFSQFLAWRLRWWLLGLPAGIGFATLRSILRLWIGIPPNKSGVFSAGNGPAMRAPIIGVFFQNDFEKMAEFLKVSTEITHTDPRAFHGAYIAALAASLSSQRGKIKPKEFKNEVLRLMPDLDKDFSGLISRAIESAEKGEQLSEFVAREGWKIGVSGFIVHTMAAVIQVWLRHQDEFSYGLEEIIEVGGDTDTTAAILGGIIGSWTGVEGIPSDWRNNIIEWPRSIGWLEEVAKKLAEVCESQKSNLSPYYPWYLIPFRNLFFIFLVLVQVIKRFFI